MGFEAVLRLPKQPRERRFQSSFGIRSVLSRILSHSLEQQPNETWIAVLRGERGNYGDRLLAQLGEYLGRMLSKMLACRQLGSEELGELTQEAMVQLVGSLHTFRGDSAFTTWATAVAARAAFTELRRRASREEKHERFQLAQRDALAEGEHSAIDVDDETLTRDSILVLLHKVIDSSLTDKQRIATLAKLRGVPTVEIADQLHSNTNAIYKLFHDARLRLREGLEQLGVTGDVVESLTGEGVIR